MNDIQMLNAKLDKIIELLEGRRTPVEYNQPAPGLREKVSSWHNAAPDGFHSIMDIAAACEIEWSKPNAIAIGRTLDSIGATRWRTSKERGFRIG